MLEVISLSKMTKTQKKRACQALLQKATKLFTDGFMSLADYNKIRIISVKYQEKLKN